MSIAETIRQNLKLQIESSPKTKMQIAEEIGMVRSVISDYISGRLFPNIFTLVKLCKSLECSYEDILGRLD